VKLTRGEVRRHSENSVLVRRREGGESSPPKAGYTLVINAHGAFIDLEMKVDPNESLSIKNAYSGEEKNSRVIRVREETGSANEVAIEFTEPAPRFWHIEFPLADWVLSRETEYAAARSARVMRSLRSGTTQGARRKGIVPPQFHFFVSLKWNRGRVYSVFRHAIIGDKYIRSV
jgi:hypothetical protein